MSRRALGALLLLLAAAVAGDGKKKDERPPKKVPRLRHALFIGNSYTSTHKLPGMVAALTKAAGLPVQLKVESEVTGGATLEDHWSEPSVRDRIRERAWDFVVLQEQSLRPLEKPARMEKFARLLHAEIKKRGAKTVFFLTWARKERPHSQEEINRAYYRIADELEAMIVPVGPAWARVRKEESRLKLYAYDGSHPSPAGTYLAACVFYAVLTGHSPLGLPARVVYKDQTLADLKPAVARYLQQAAWKTAIS